MTRIWPTRLAVREGLLGVRAAGWVTVTVTTATSVVLAAAGLANALDVSRLVAAEHDWIASGGLTYIVEGGRAAEDSIRVDSCERLAAIDGVAGSFALEVTGEAAEVTSAPGSRGTVVRVSAGVYPFFDLPAVKGETVIAASGFADAAGLVDGEHTELARTRDGLTTRTPVTVSTLDHPVLTETLVGAVLVPELVGGRADQCFVSVEPGHASTLEEYLAVALSSDPTSPALVRPRLAGTPGSDFATAFEHRPLGWAWAAAAFVLVVLWSSVQQARRRRMAVYASFGAHARARLTIQLTEWFAMTGLGAVWGWASATALALGLGAHLGVTMTQVTAQLAAAWCAASIGAVVVGLVPVGSLLEVLKDRT